MQLNPNKLKIVNLIKLYFKQLVSSNYDLWKRKCLFYMINCRTGKLGYTNYVCSNCGDKISVANACNNRHCPNCGSKKRASWAEKVSKKLLPVGHFHLVFTLPHQLNSVIYKNPVTMLNILIKSVSDTLTTFTKNKNKNASPAFIQVLHTWTQRLELHYHVHVLIANGFFLENKWHKGDKNFLFSVHAMDKVFKAKFLEKFEFLIEDNLLIGLPTGTATEIISSYNLPMSWNIYAAAPYNSERVAIKYFARYANRVGISDYRIIASSDTAVTFSCRKDNCEKEACKKTTKSCTLSTMDFLYRFCLHILPKGFRKIRYQGLYAGAASQKNIEAAIKSLEVEDKATNFKLDKSNNICKKCSSVLITASVFRIPLSRVRYYDTG